MRPAKLHRMTANVGSVAMTEGRVLGEAADGALHLHEGGHAWPAVSCLIRPRRGDRVLVAWPPGQDGFILHVLQRESAEGATLEVPGTDAVTLHQRRLTIAGSEAVAIRSLRDMELTAATGTLAINARNLFSTVQDSVVHNARYFIAHIGTYAMQVKNLMRLHGRQAIITADQDIKVDAERISMG